ncbi:MAG TPA: hypothetical protein PJ986_11475 [Gammaproteobacteria bacterium]|nr:hypothetical protein [Gammaproteobacteria bacterium]
MRSNSLLLAAALALAPFASQAFDPGAVSAAYQMVIAGSSSSSTALRHVLIRDVCETGQPVDVLIHGGATPHFNVACRVGGQNVLFRKNEGGSGPGVVAVDGKSMLPFLNVGFAGCTASVSKQAGTKTYTEYSNCGSSTAALANLVPDFAISDVEPTAFTSALAPSGASFLNVSPVTVQPIASLGLGFVATTDLYRALQAVRFPSTSDCNPDPAGGSDMTRPDPANPHLRIAGANGIKDSYETLETDAGVANNTANAPAARHMRGDTQKCMPILSRDEVRSLLARDLTSGNSIWAGPNAADTLASRTAGKDYAGIGNGAISLCRRNSGSGVHAVTSMHFLSTNCGLGSVAVSAGSCSNSALCSINSSESANGVEACLNTHAASNVWAVGYQSTEKNADLKSNYRFLKIDGVAPTLAHTLDGNLGNFAELVAVRRSNVNDLVNVANAGFIGAANGAWAAIVSQLSTATNVGNVDALPFVKQPFGAAGYAARGTPTFPPNAAAPINPLSHVRPGTSAQNTCAGPYSTPVGGGTGKGIAR